MSAPSLEVSLVAPRLWRPLLEGASPLAVALLEVMHNRHVGLTVELATSLANELSERGSGPAVEPWQRVLNRLRRAYWRTGDHQSAFIEKRTGFVPRSMPAYFILRIALPLVHAACCQIGRSCVFCEEEPEGVPQSQYREYGEALAQALSTLVADGGDGWDVFWEERALSLAGQSRRLLRGDAELASLPDSDAAAAALLLRLTSRLPPRTAHHRETLRAVLPQPTFKTARFREGGVDGIYQTLREEDVNYIRQSEFLYPPSVLEDRLMNTGFLALRRPPLREHVRDVLVAVLLPAPCSSGLPGAFLKACWFDLCARFGERLVQCGLLKSEFRFFEANALGQARAIRFSLEHLEAMQRAGETGLRQDFRHDFLVGLGWLPPYLNARGRYHEIKLPEPSPGPSDPGIRLEELREWVLAVWRSQRRGQLTDAADRLAHPEPDDWFDVEDFAGLHLIVTLPADLRAGEKPDDLAGPLYWQLKRGLCPGQQPARNVSVAWVPSRLQPSDDWVVDTHDQLGRQLFAESNARSTPDDAATLSGAVVGVWLEQLEKELLGE